MTVAQFRGLTWDHPRGYDPLAQAARDRPGLIDWDKQPLEGFESTPIEEICARYDVVVIDHPHLGDALAAKCLVPLHQVIRADDLAAIRSRTIGPCYDSYVMDGHAWALPLDAAAQVSAGRPELLNGPMPHDWFDVERIAKSTHGFTLSLAGPHAFLTLLSLCATTDDRFGPIADGLFQPHHDEAIALFCDLMRRSHPIGATHNPIGILSAMAAGAGPTYTPLIFGYVPYAAANATHPVIFRDAPRVSGMPRAVLGGTGIAITTRCVPNAALVEHLVWLMSAEAQIDFLPRHNGQPSAEEAWNSPALNGSNNDFYAGTLDTLRHAFVRPRSQAFVSAQNRAAEWLRGFHEQSAPTSSLVRAKVNDMLMQDKAGSGC